MELLSNEDLKIDIGETTLSCVHLRRQKCKGSNNFLSEYGYGPIPLDSVRRLVQIVSIRN